MEGTTSSSFNVGGVLLDRPFKIRRLGHFGLNVDDVKACLPFYTDLLGFSISDALYFGRRIEDEEVRKGFDTTVGYFMRHGSDHHSFVLFPRPAVGSIVDLHLVGHPYQRWGLTNNLGAPPSHIFNLGLLLQVLGDDPSDVM